MVPAPPLRGYAKQMVPYVIDLGAHCNLIQLHYVKIYYPHL